MAGGMPLAFTQEDFLVKNLFIYLFVQGWSLGSVCSGANVARIFKLAFKWQVGYCIYYM